MKRIDTCGFAETHHLMTVNNGFTGVRASGERWHAQIHYGGKKHHLGTFDTKEAAALAYDRAARERGGGTRKLNYPSKKIARQQCEMNGQKNVGCPSRG
jgi:hypothetical protein